MLILLHTHKQMATKLVQEGERGENQQKMANQISADGFVDYGQWADLGGSEALSKANPSGPRTF